MTLSLWLARYMQYCMVELKQHTKTGPLHSNQNDGKAILAYMLMFFKDGSVFHSLQLPFVGV